MEVRCRGGILPGEAGRRFDASTQAELKDIQRLSLGESAAAFGTPLTHVLGSARERDLDAPNKKPQGPMAL